MSSERRAKKKDRKQRRAENKAKKKLGLQPGESVVIAERPSVMMTLPKMLLTAGLYSLWRNRNIFVITSQRVLLGKGVFSRTETSIPISRVHDAGFNRRGLASYTKVEVRGHRPDVRVGPLSSKRAHRFTSELQSHLS